MVIILVMCCGLNQDYKNLEKTIKETWYKNKNSSCEILFYEGGSEKLSFKENKIFLPCKDNSYTEKTMMAFEYVSKTREYSYLFRTNLGSYVYQDKLIKFLEDKPKNNFYCGIIGENNGVKFSSGSGYFLSKDLVNLCLNNKNKINYNCVDDLSVGMFMKENGVKIDESALRLTISENNFIYSKGDNSFDEKIEKDLIYHVRLRSEDRNIDVKKMESLYKNGTFSCTQWNKDVT
jgi:hypothetical protein